jgi:hypothetical protein
LHAGNGRAGGEEFFSRSGSSIAGKNNQPCINYSPYFNTLPSVCILCIQHLDISGCRIDGADFALVADAINGMGSLLRLDLSHNRIANKSGGKALSDMIAHNSVLEASPSIISYSPI